MRKVRALLRTFRFCLYTSIAEEHHARGARQRRRDGKQAGKQAGMISCLLSYVLTIGLGKPNGIA
jgi:hypothetical protein